MSERVYQIDLERDEGWHLPSGERWRGYRVRYRPLGSRGRWVKFLLVDQDAEPSIAQLQDICRKHAESSS